MEPTPPTPQTSSEQASPAALRALAIILAFAFLSTTIHYIHNFVAASSYPPVFPFVNDLAYRIGIAIFYPLGTALAIWAYRLYRDGREAPARRLLAAYSLLGLTSVGHFVGGVPDVPPFFFATMFTDFLSGVAILAFVVWSAREDHASRAFAARAQEVS